jgi:type IV fimbrial biogenesis protein FimT
VLRNLGGQRVSRRVVSGFTLIELMTTVVVAAVLLTVAVPSFRAIIQNNRLAGQTNEFVTALSVARSEAVKRGVRVTVCRTNDGAASSPCNRGSSWADGWIVFLDPDKDGQPNSAADVLRVAEALPDGLSATGNANVADYVSYLSTGVTALTSGAFQAGTVTICSTETHKGRAVVISAIGRARVDETTC